MGCYDQLNCYDENGNLLPQFMNYEIYKNLYTLRWEEAAKIVSKHAKDVSSLLFELKPLTYQIGVLLKKGIPVRPENAVCDCSYESKRSFILKNNSNDCLIVIDTLIALAKKEKLHILNSFNTIYISPSSVKDLIDWYVYSGDELPYSILSWLRENRNRLTFISPDLLKLAESYYLKEYEDINWADMLIATELKMEISELDV